MKWSRSRLASIVAVAATSVLVLTACGGESTETPDSTEGATESAPAESDDAAPADGITLTISTFNEWGYEDLLTEYQELNPGIIVEHQKYATSNEARDAFNTGLAAGSGLEDVVGVEVDWMPEILQWSDNFVDLADPAVEGRWPDWKVQQGSTPDGKLIGYGTDIGPEAIAYRADLFEQAGLPTDRAEVAELFGGADATWDEFFAVGRDFTDATGIPFYDSGDAVVQGILNQQEAPFEDPATDEIIVLDNQEVRDTYDLILDNSGISAGLAQWGEDWVNAFQTDGFAVMLAPSWMLGVIEGNAAGITGWDLADVFPGGGGNWGGSFLTVPTQSEHPEEARALADWLTAPEQQIRAFQSTGNFPSQIEAQEDPELQAITNAFFNDAPIGEIFTNRSNAITVSTYKGPNYFAIRDSLSQAINRVEADGTDDAESSWAKFVEAVNVLG